MGLRMCRYTVWIVVEQHFLTKLHLWSCAFAFFKLQSCGCGHEKHLSMPTSATLTHMCWNHTTTAYMYSLVFKPHCNQLHVFTSAKTTSRPTISIYQCWNHTTTNCMYSSVLKSHHNQLHVLISAETTTATNYMYLSVLKPHHNHLNLLISAGTTPQPSECTRNTTTKCMCSSMLKPQQDQLHILISDKTSPEPMTRTVSISAETTHTTNCT